jgi:hypothetical protein
MVGFDVREVIYGVVTVTRTTLLKGVVGIENLPGEDDIPLPNSPPASCPSSPE